MMTAAWVSRQLKPLLLAGLLLTANVLLLLCFCGWRQQETRVDVWRAEVVLNGDEGMSSTGERGLGCASLAELSEAQLLSSGWTKAVYGGRLGERRVAVKRVNFHGHDMSRCVGGGAASLGQCYRQAAAKILKELVLLKELLHINVLQVLGYCIPKGDEEMQSGSDGGIALITELGEGLDIIRLLQSSWEDRLRLTLGVSRVVHHLAHSPLGSLVMNDFRRQQFVLVEGELKLSDVDDVEFEEPVCSTDQHCTIRHQAAELVLTVRCVRGRCRGYNEKQNIYNAGRHFVVSLLPHGAPPALRPQVDALVAAYANVSWDSARILHAVQRIHHLFTTGQYLDHPRHQQALRGYRRVEQSDLPAMYDYRCHLTFSGTGCTLSVFDEAEAAAICDADSDCAAFVLTSHTSWTGRRMVHFKSNFSNPVFAEQMTLFVKQSPDGAS